MAFSTQHFRTGLTRPELRGSDTPLYVLSWNSGFVIWPSCLFGGFTDAG